MINIKVRLFLIFGLLAFVRCSAIDPYQNTQPTPNIITTAENIQPITTTPTQVYPQAEEIEFASQLFPKNNQKLTWQDFPTVRKLYRQPEYEMAFPIYICADISFSAVAEYGDHLTGSEEMRNRLEIFINSKPINKENYSVSALPLLIIVDMGENGEQITTASAGDYCWDAEGFIREGINEVEIYFHKTSGAIAKQSWEFEILNSEN